MKQHSIIILLAFLVVGCAVLAEPKWSENYALKGVCDVEQLNDGSMYTSGQTHPPEYVKGEKPDDSRFNDAIITLKSPQEIRRIVVRRRPEDTVPVDLNIYAMIDNQWQLIKDVRGEAKSDIDVKINAIKTDKIKVRAQRSVRTAGGKSAVVQSGGRGRIAGGRGGAAEVERILREPVKFAEIELYGLQTEETGKTEK